MYCKSKALKHFRNCQSIVPAYVMEWLILMQSSQYDTLVPPSNLKLKSGGFNALMSFVGRCQHPFGSQDLICKVNVLLVVLIYCESIIGIRDYINYILEVIGFKIDIIVSMLKWNAVSFLRLKISRNDPSAFTLRKIGEIMLWLLNFIICNGLLRLG